MNGHIPHTNGHDTVTPPRIKEHEPPELPPFNPEAEQRVLGSLLNDNKIYPRLARFLRLEHFGNALHARVFDAIANLIERGEIANPVTLRRYFEHDQALREVGGARYLGQLAEAGFDAIGAEDYAGVVVELWRDREADNLWEHYRTARRHRTAGIGGADYLAHVHSRLEEVLHNGTALQAINPVSLMGLPVPQHEWTVVDWIPLRRATGLYGAPGAGKSLLMQMLCTAAALDPAKFPHATWLGLPVRKCRSVLFYCEDDAAEMHVRQEQINRPFGCTFADLEDMRWMPFVGKDGALMTFDRDGRGTVTPLFYQLRGLIKQHRAQLVILDTLSDVFGGNEVVRSQARQFVQQVPARLARDCSGSVVCCAHPSLTGINSKSGSSGSTAWPGAFRSHLYLHPLDADPDEIADTDQRQLTRKKSNWARAGETVEMRWDQGVFIHKPQPTGIMGWIGRGHADRVFLALLDEMCKQHRPLSPNQAANNYAPRVFGAMPKDKREGFRTKDFHDAMERLLSGPKPAISIEEYGPPSRRFVRLNRAPVTC